MNNPTDNERPLGSVIEEEVAKLPTELEEDRERLATPFQDGPRPSNADNTAIDPAGNIHSGDALPDPIGETLTGETARESLDYYSDEVLDDDPMLGSPEGLRNRADETRLENVADMDENVLDRLNEPEG